MRDCAITYQSLSSCYKLMEDFRKAYYYLEVSRSTMLAAAPNDENRLSKLDRMMTRAEQRAIS